METTTTTGKTTSSGWNYTFHYGYPQQGWECPRCGRINAPWISQCCCPRGYWTPSWTSDHIDIEDKPEWWKEVTCGDSCPDNVMNNPNTYQVGGSDYWNPTTKTYENVPTHISNKIDLNSVTTAWNHSNTKTIHNGNTNYKE